MLRRKTRSMRDNDLIADWSSTDRGRTAGVGEALAVTATLRAGSRILDLGCGNGVPITEALVQADHRVVGLDSSTEMLAHFRAICPARLSCAVTLAGVRSQTAASTRQFHGG